MRTGDHFEKATPSGLQRELQRLVDGNLPADEYRRLLKKLQTHPEGWQKCALAFLENQALENDLAGMSIDDLFSAEPKKTTAALANQQPIGRGPSVANGPRNSTAVRSRAAATEPARRGRGFLPAISAIVLPQSLNYQVAMITAAVIAFAAYMVQPPVSTGSPSAVRIKFEPVHAIARTQFTHGGSAIQNVSGAKDNFAGITHAVSTDLKINDPDGGLQQSVPVPVVCRSTTHQGGGCSQPFLKQLNLPGEPVHRVIVPGPEVDGRKYGIPIQTFEIHPDRLRRFQ